MNVDRDIVIEALDDWKAAEYQYRDITGDMIEFQIYKISAKRSRYESLLKMLKELEQP